MKKILMVTMMLILFAGISWAGKATETLTVSSTSVALANAGVALGEYSKAVCSVDTDAIRFWTSGQNPTATAGVYIASGSTITLTGEDIPKFRAIRVTGDAAVNCIYWGF